MKGMKKVFSTIWNIIGSIVVIILSPILIVGFFIVDQVIPNWK